MGASQHVSACMSLEVMFSAVRNVRKLVDTLKFSIIDSNVGRQVHAG